MASQYTQVYLIIAVGVITVLLLAGSIILFVVYYQKKMTEEQWKRQLLESEFQQKILQAELESQENERRRLAADLHDSIGGMLSTIRVGISTIGRSMQDPSAANDAKSMLDETISSVRRISRDLMPSTLEKFGLVHALQELAERFQATSGINIEYQEEGAIVHLEKNKELTIFRIVQELVNNAVKHAHAETIRINLSVHDLLELSVEDDGVGFDADAEANKSGKSLGLFNLENRAKLLGAQLEFEKHRAKGTKAVIKLPLRHVSKA